MINRRLAIVIETIGIFITSIAVALELIYKADLYLGLITIGCLVFASGSGVYAKVVKGG